MLKNSVLTINQIESLLKGQKPLLETKYKVKGIGIFGSFSRHEQKPSSDLDILVEFHQNIGLFEFIELKQYLIELLGLQVDLVMKDSLKPRLKSNILKEVIYL